MTLIDRLRRLAELWGSAQGKELSTLGTQVAKDGKFFGRLADGKGCTIALFERFLAFFRDPANWPDAAIPGEAAEQLDEIANIAVATPDALIAPPPAVRDKVEWPLPSSDNEAEIIGAGAGDEAAAA